jgi:hypothetical protein
MYILDFSIITISSSLSSAHTISHASRFSKARCSPAQQEQQQQQQDTYTSVSEHTQIHQYQGTHTYISIRAHICISVTEHTHTAIVRLYICPHTTIKTHIYQYQSTRILLSCDYIYVSYYYIDTYISLRAPAYCYRATIYVSSYYSIVAYISVPEHTHTAIVQVYMCPHATI